MTKGIGFAKYTHTSSNFLVNNSMKYSTRRWKGGFEKGANA